MTAATAPVAGTIAFIPLSEIYESPLNPRKHFDEEKLQQLADSMTASGQLESALARPR
ncbi:MAG: ParB N-terminal domain-containing protein, partial [Gemmatimonadales bacterium]|nr:ParB N-terminal domain-containing protein [Gemmatimonadales bacterium]